MDIDSDVDKVVAAKLSVDIPPGVVVIATVEVSSLTDDTASNDVTPLDVVAATVDTSPSIVVEIGSDVNKEVDGLISVDVSLGGVVIAVVDTTSLNDVTTYVDISASMMVEVCSNVMTVSSVGVMLVSSEYSVGLPVSVVESSSVDVERSFDNSK